MEAQSLLPLRLELPELDRLSTDNIDIKIVGWGSESDDGIDRKDDLKWARLKVMNKQKCLEASTAEGGWGPNQGF